MFTQEEIERLLKNENVSRCSNKSITYDKKFKLRAVRLYKQGFSSSEIFKQAGFDIEVTGKDQPTECLRRWNKTYKVSGGNGFSVETRGRGKGGGRPKTKNLTDADKIKRLEIEVAYLKEENDFLAKLRAKRRE